jgi:preprotein translocase subunit YajC
LQMNVRTLLLSIPGALCFALFLVTHLVAQDPPPTPPPAQSAGQQATPPEGGQGRGDRRPGVFGKITAINGQTMQIATMRGDTVTVKLSSDTQFRKDREAAKLTDFKVGDTVAIRGEENPDHSWTAQAVNSRAGGFGGGAGGGSAEGRAPGGGAGGQGQGMRPQGVLGQDYVAGEIKAIDAPKLTILRTDNVSQTIELDENTSLHRGRDSITMADIQPGDHVFVRGGMVNNSFQPRNVMIVSPEQWKRMQENGMAGGGGANAQTPKPPQSPDNSKPQNP